MEQAIAKWHSEASIPAVSGSGPAPVAPTERPSRPVERSVPPPRVAVSLAALRPTSGSSGRRIVSETEKVKSKEDLRKSLEKIMSKVPPPNLDLGRQASNGSLASNQPVMEPKKNEVSREVLENLLKTK